MRILLVCSSLGTGGAERVAVNLATFFARMGHEVTYFYWDKRAGQSYQVCSELKLTRSLRRNFFSRVISLCRLIRKDRPDAIIGFTDISNVIAVLSAALVRSNARVAVSVHSDLRARDANLRRTVRRRIMKTLHRIACMRAEVVVAVSDGVKRAITEYYGISPKRIHRIYNPVLPVVSAHPQKTKAGAARLVAVGRLTAAKNYPLMIQTIGHLAKNPGSSVHLTIFGDGEERQSLCDLVKKSGLSARITFEGFQQDLMERLRDYDLFLMTSRWEGFGNVLVEALDAGLRIVSTDCPSGPSEILDRGRFGVLVEGSDPRRIAECVSHSLASEAFDDVSARRDHLRKFSLEYAGDQYLRALTAC